LACYYIAPKGWRNAIALSGSLFFYAWGEPVFVFVLSGLSFADYLISQPLAQSQGRAQKFWLSLGLTLNLSVLIWYKYIGFLSQQFLSLGFLNSLPFKDQILPLGISFFTFQKMSYLIDVYRHKTKPCPGFVSYLLYVSLFPQLIAGPIVRYHDIATQLLKRRLSLAAFNSGIHRFGLGLGAKVLIANPLGEAADFIFKHATEMQSSTDYWFGLLCYGFQIYFDFSGYSHMAIGLGLMMGFNFPENFNRPYLATSITDFWRRWHISLSAWMHQYLYISLGGNRVAPMRTILNLWLVFLISGFWHGASWNFILWGAFHGLFLSLEKFLPQAGFQIPSGLRRIIIFIIILQGWVLFRTETLAEAQYWFTHLYTLPAQLNPLLFRELHMSKLLTLLGLATLISFAPLLSTFKSKPNATTPLALSFSLFLILLATLSLANASYNPFIYFRF
jgi:alginate O-acetyltransferase complex protein AlgI